MKVVFTYADLLQNLKDLAIVVEDVMSGDDMKNIIIRVAKDNVTLLGINQLVTFKRVLKEESYRLEVSDEELDDSGYLYLQIKSKELIGYLDSYKSLRRTEVEDVEFTLPNKLTVVCKVAEKNLETGEIYLSSYNFNNIPIKKGVLGNINLKAPEGDGDSVPVVNILFHTRNMLPIMKNDPGLFGQLVFGSDGVVVAFNAAFNTFMENELNGVFSGIKLSYRAISFIDKIFSNDGEVICKKMDRYIYIYSEETQSEAFIIYDNKLPNYGVTKNLFVRDHAFVLDRIYLKDTLKRLSLANESVQITIKCEENVVEVRNSKFNQTVPILQKKALDEFNNISFKILPDTLGKVIIGNDDEFSTETFVYYCPQPNGDAMIVFSDNSGKWFSTVKVRPTKQREL